MVSRKWARSAEHGTVRTAGRQPAKHLHQWMREARIDLTVRGLSTNHVVPQQSNSDVVGARRGPPLPASREGSVRENFSGFLSSFFLSFCLLIRFYKKPPISFSFFWSRYNNLHILVNTIYTIKPLSDSANYCHLERHCNSRWHQCWHHQKWLREPGRPPRMNWKNGWEEKM